MVRKKNMHICATVITCIHAHEKCKTNKTYDINSHTKIPLFIPLYVLDFIFSQPFEQTNNYPYCKHFQQAPETNFVRDN